MSEEVKAICNMLEYTLPRVHPQAALVVQAVIRTLKQDAHIVDGFYDPYTDTALHVEADPIDRINQRYNDLEN